MAFWGRARRKVFCVGQNKTGTTSLAAALRDLGFRIGKQRKAELLIEDWAKRDFRRIIRHCRNADAFLDIPFSLPETYKAVDAAFPGSKFVLTIRKDACEWYDSLTRFHTKIVGKNRMPTAEDLKEFGYRYKGWAWRVQELVYGIDESSVYSKPIYVELYESHNKQVQQYFRNRSSDLLVLNLSEASAMERLCSFLGIKYRGQTMPHLNISK